MDTEIRMPQLGQTSDEVRFIRWLVKEGQEVKRGQPLCEVETDKVTMELESVAGGIISGLQAKPDEQIKAGSVIALIKAPGEADSSVADETGTGKADINYVGFKHENAENIAGLKTGYSTTAAIRLSAFSSRDRKKVLSEIGPDKAVEMYRMMLTIREFEEAIKMLFLEGKMPGTIHQYIGMEACAVGVCSALEKDDVIASTHRPHGHAIARGLSVDEIMAELYGKTTGCCHGKGGSMHIGDLEKGMLPAIAIVGGNLPIVGGMALAFKMRGEKRVAVSFFGDGASNEGAFHEALNMAAIYGIPAVFVCENNLYGASTSINQVLKIENIAQRVCAYGMRGDIADGMDVLDVYRKAKTAVSFARHGNGPTLLELKTFRLCGHSRRDPCNYIPKAERQYWSTKDPIANYEKILLSEAIADKGNLDRIRKMVQGEIKKAVEFGQSGPDPDPEETYNGLYVDMEVPR